MKHIFSKETIFFLNRALLGPCKLMLTVLGQTRYGRGQVITTNKVL